MGKAKLRACYYCKAIMKRNSGLTSEAVFTRLTPCSFLKKEIQDPRTNASGLDAECHKGRALHVSVFHLHGITAFSLSTVTPVLS